MSQFVSNSKVRRNAILRFTALFLVTVALACFVFLRLFYVKKEVEADKLQQFEEIAPVLDKLVAYGKSLQDYEEALTTNPVKALELKSQAQKKAGEVYGVLLGKEKNPHYDEFNKVQAMGDRFFNFLQSSEGKFMAIQKDLDACKDDKKDLENDLEEKDEKIQELNEKIAKCRKW
jgi:hypothetical protein